MYSTMAPVFLKTCLTMVYGRFAPAVSAAPVWDLAMVQRFVKDVGGTIKLGNQQPHGACVTAIIAERMPSWR